MILRRRLLWGSCNLGARRVFGGFGVVLWGMGRRRRRYGDVCSLETAFGSVRVGDGDGDIVFTLIFDGFQLRPDCLRNYYNIYGPDLEYGALIREVVAPDSHRRPAFRLPFLETDFIKRIIDRRINCSSTSVLPYAVSILRHIPRTMQICCEQTLFQFI
jgi:hypothetical protein